MAILLPQPRLPAKLTIQFLDYGVDLAPPGGGDIQRINKLGSRFAAAVDWPRLKPEPDGRILLSALRQAKLLGALFPITQPGLAIGAPGAPVVDGTAASGTALPLRGFTPGYAVQIGQFFSIIVNSRRFLHHATAVTVADGNGKMSLPIFPMLRTSPGDGSIAEFAQPYIEGPISGNMLAVELTIARAQPASIVITERS